MTNNDSDKAIIKKFRYVAPENIVLPRSTGPSQSSFNFDDVWNIRNNVSVNLKEKQAVSSWSFSSAESSSSTRNMLYSRHQANLSNPSQLNYKSNHSQKSTISLQKTGSNTSLNSSNATALSLGKDSSTSTPGFFSYKRNNHQRTNEIDESLPSLNGAKVNSNSHGYNRNYSSKYNVAFYNSGTDKAE